ncbi:integral membrane protein [Niveomyces insectorum RCEF 264]|uniref:Integral membrane protein n=1 Tax=Niveomyces insectorum RCEF 264 TaxID=1081102 RepID=A0A167VK16_9HYPO|nr:integral membrane protein [Niveomyces insectorum RCEF 264]
MHPKHPLQRLASPARSASLVLHLAGIGSFIASFVYLHRFPQMPGGSVGGNFQFLTILGLALSLVTYALGAAADVTGATPLFAAKNVLAVCVAPLEVLVSLLYWSLQTIDPHLLYPPDLPAELVLPVLPDVGFHLAPAVFLTLDLLLCSPPWTIHVQEALLLSLALACSYWAWIEYCFSHNGFYPYPIFQLLNTPQRILLFGFSAVLMTGCTVLLKRLYRMTNGEVVRRLAGKEE